MYCVKLNNNEIHCPDVNSESHCLARRSLGREKQLAIFFLDIRNYTKLMDTYAHYDVLFIARILLESFCKTIISLGGKIIEVSGDNIYAVFGINSDLRSAVRSSLKAARAVLAQLKEFNQEHIFPYCNSILEIGIGLHQGNVIVGRTKILGRSQLTVMGLPVNIASRIQGETKILNNNLLVSEEAFSMLADEDLTHESFSVMLRGVSNPVKLHLLGNPYEKVPPVAPAEDQLPYHMAVAG